MGMVDGVFCQEFVASKMLALRRLLLQAGCLLYGDCNAIILIALLVIQEKREKCNMLINLSNHPLDTWSDQQKQEAEKQFGRIVDLQFPPIAPESDLDQIAQIATEYVDICFKQFEQENPSSFQNAVHVMGEMTFVYQFVKMMSELGVVCVASTTRRIVVAADQNEKTSKFEFVRFRPYSLEFF